jgi:predicted transcriptional regulator
MLKELLIKIAQGNNSISGLSRALNLEPSNVKDKLDMLAHLGYLKKIETCTDKQAGLDNKGDDQFECKHCLLAKNCKETSGEMVHDLIGYSLTKKGERYLGKL